MSALILKKINGRFYVLSDEAADDEQSQHPSEQGNVEEGASLRKSQSIFDFVFHLNISITDAWPA